VAAAVVVLMVEEQMVMTLVEVEEAVDQEEYLL
jgi:hypothetical protein